jgi:NAD(P)-dependent dehydrogenase (short-subunit alcohol dehydrogenase family)
MQGKTILITGATDGIGKETALALAGRGARVLLAGRDPEKTDLVARTIRGMTANPDVIPLVADLTQMRQAHSLADEVLKRANRLDGLVNNAGAIYPEYQRTDEGFEATFALNYLSAFLLTTRLLPLLLAGGGGRVVNVASVIHKQRRYLGESFDLAGLRAHRGAAQAGYHPARALAQAKYALVLFTFALARAYRGAGLTANALHPGFVATKHMDALSARDRLAFSVTTRLMGVSPTEGAATSVYLAASPEVSAVSGMYFMNCKPAMPADGARDQAMQDALWAQSETWTTAPQGVAATA